MSKSIGIALGGGGVRGIAHLPILRTLDELGVRPAFVAGTSMGAILGALYASGMSGADIEERIRQHIVLRDDNLRSLIKKSTHLKDWLKAFTPGFGSAGLVTADGVFKHLFNELQDLDFVDLNIPFAAIACDYWTGEEVIQNSGAVLPAVQASMAVPGVFPPVQLNDHYLIDGGVVNNLPYELVQENTDICIAVDVTNLPAKDSGSKPKPIEVATGALDIMQLDAIKKRLDIQKPDFLLRPKIESIGMFDFHKIEHVLDMGERAADQLRAELETILG